MENHARSGNWEIVAVYRENESAWTKGHQREFARLPRDCRSGQAKFDTVLAWALDRLSRKGAAAILNLLNTFKRYEVRMISYQEPWTEAPGEMGEILYAIAGWVARMESQRRPERTKAAQARAIREGKKLGRPKGRKDKRRRKNTGYLLRYATPSLRGKYGK